MTIPTPIRILVVATTALALGVPLAQAKFTIPDGTLATGGPPSYTTDAHGRQPITAVDSGAPPDAFDRAVNAARRDVLTRSAVDSGAPPDAFERAVNRAVRGGSVRSDSHERSETPVGGSTIGTGDDGGLAWIDLSIGIFIGIALAGLGALVALTARGRGRVAHS
jgi:hypothetical protein